MKNSSNRSGAVNEMIKGFFTRHLAVKIIALVFATMLWGYVLTDQKPIRVLTIPDVTTSFDGEAELLAQGLCIRGDRDEILRNVSVQVRAQITDYAYISANSITATISLKNISEARTYTLPVQATVASSLGVVQSITPATVEVEIDSLQNRTVPVTTTFSGVVPDGYWADMEAMSATTVLNVQGAKTDVSRITRAECAVSLEGRTSTIYSAFDVVLYDAEDQVIDKDVVVGTIPSCTVRLPIYLMKTVQVDVANSLIGTDNLAANHEMVAAVATPATVRIVGEQSVIDEIEGLLLEPINVGGMSSATTLEGELIVPDGVRLLDNMNVSIQFDVRESTMTQTFEQLPIEVRNLREEHAAALDVTAVDLTVDGRYSLVSVLKRSDVQVFVDVAGLIPGSYTLPISLLVRDEEKTVELTTTLSAASVNVVITDAK